MLTGHGFFDIVSDKETISLGDRNKHLISKIRMEKEEFKEFDQRKRSFKENLQIHRKGIFG